MSLETDDRDHEGRRDWGAGELPIGNESAAQRLSKRVKPGRRGRIDPTILGAVVLVALVGGICAYGSLDRGGDAQVAALAGEEIPAPPLSPEDAVQQGLASGSGAGATDPAVSAAPLSQPPEPAAAAASDESATAPTTASAPLGASAPAPAGSASVLEEEVVAAPALGAPAAKTETAALAKPAGAPAANLPAGAFRVQLLAMSSEQAAQRAWTDLAKSHRDLLGKLSPNVVRADLGAKGTVYRVQAGPLADRASADELCGALAKRGTGCIVVVN
jgi:cell division septation protein DedD